MRPEEHEAASQRMGDSTLTGGEGEEGTATCAEDEESTATDGEYGGPNAVGRRMMLLWGGGALLIAVAVVVVVILTVRGGGGSFTPGPLGLVPDDVRYVQV